jgi:hypothetical protein
MKNILNIKFLNQIFLVVLIVSIRFPSTAQIFTEETDIVIPRIMYGCVDLGDYNNKILPILRTDLIQS